MSVYLALIHGRHDPDEELDGWGFKGPTLGPFAAIHVTYLSSLRCIRADDTELEIKFCQDMAVYLHCYYGDFEITSQGP